MYSSSSIFSLVPLGQQSSIPPSSSPSGWSKEARLAIPQQLVQLNNFGIWIDETYSELKQIADGGVLTSSSAQDVRFEKVSDGSVLPWDMVHYDSSTGRLVAFVNLGNVASDLRYDFRMLLGKSGAVEQNMSGAWQNTIAAWFGSDGTNREGTTSRNLTVSGVLADSVDPWKGTYDGTSYRMYLSDATFLDGFSEISVEAFVKSDLTGTNRHVIHQGPAGTSNNNISLMLRHDSEGYFGGGTNIWAVNLRIYDGIEYWSVRYESASNTQTTGWQHLIFSWKSGALPKLYIDGKLDLPTWVGRERESDGNAEQNVAISGTTKMMTGEFSVGGDPTIDPWDGQIAFVCIRPSSIGSTQALLYGRNRQEPKRIYGISQFVDGSPTNIPVVALPKEGSQEQNTTISYDVAADAYDPDDTPSLTSAGSVSGTISSATVNSGKLDVTAGSNVGNGTAAFVVTGGSTTSSSKVYVEVTGGSSSSEYPAPLRTINVSDSSELSTALASAQPGDHIVLADGVYSLSSRIDIAASGTAQDPIVVRAENKLGANLQGAGLQLSGDHIWLWGLYCSNPSTTRFLDVGGDTNQILRCRFNMFGTAVKLTTGTGAKILRCEFTCPSKDSSSPDNRTIYVSKSSSQNHTNAEIAYCWFHDMPFKTSNYSDRIRAAISVGDDTSDGALVTSHHIHHNLLENTGDCEISIKTSGNLIEYCTATGDNATVMRQRNGQDNTFKGCWQENALSYVEIMGLNNKFVGCKLVGATFWVFAGDMEADDYSGSGNYPRAKNTTLAWCDGAVHVGKVYGSNDQFPALDTRIEAHTGNISYGIHSGTGVNPTSAEPVVTPVFLTNSDVGPDAP